ncbi:hypothetical protein CsSME_00043381 [Camellia sinensis var. sinensis]
MFLCRVTWCKNLQGLVFIFLLLEIIFLCISLLKISGPVMVARKCHDNQIISLRQLIISECLINGFLLLFLQLYIFAEYVISYSSLVDAKYLIKYNFLAHEDAQILSHANSK